MQTILKLTDAILLLLKYKFLDIFWFSFWVFLMGEMFLYSAEKLLGYKAIIRWYDMAWLMVVFIACFLISYRLYILVLNAKV